MGARPTRSLRDDLPDGSQRSWGLMEPGRVVDTPKAGHKERSGSQGNRSGAVPVNSHPPKRERFLPRIKGIYHVGCTDYPDPTYP